METLEIRMLGDFTIQAGACSISDKDNRTKKIWQLMSYMIYQRGKVVPQRKLIELLWGEDSGSSNPENALRITFHRMRQLLDRLWPTAGRELIIHKDNGYLWNDSIPVTLDYEIFEQLCAVDSEDSETVLRSRMQAIELYNGDFLEKQTSQIWIIPIATHYHNLYLLAVQEAAHLLGSKDCHREASDICRKAVLSEPYHEPIHRLLMQELAADGDTQGAAAVYDSLNKRLFDDFGIRPAEETRQLYRKLVHSPSDKTLPMDEVLEHLREQEAAAGALQCDYDYFKVLCHAESRSMERNGNVTHVVLLSVTGSLGQPLAKRTLNRIMEQLGDEIRMNLRRGDTFSQCSVSQYIIMLPQANYENSCMVCRRVIGAFQRAHPHVAARINHMVQPLTPTICVP